MNSKKLPSIKLAETETLVLRCCRHDMTSYGGFVWPKKGIVKAPDWRKNNDCGNGLHGWRNGEGNPEVWSHSDNDVWIVLAVKTADIIDLEGKVKFPQARVLYAGSREIATALAVEHSPKARVNYGTATAGDYGTATVGDRGTATAGDGGTATAGNYGTATASDCGTATARTKGTATVGYKGTATAGDYGTATAGYEGTATAGDGGTATAGDSGTATAGECGTATVGDYGTATAGYEGTATAGYEGTATVGYKGTATAGDKGTATAGECGTATAGNKGTICIKWWDIKADRCRLIIGYVGENGLEAGKKYKLDKHAQFVLAE